MESQKTKYLIIWDCLSEFAVAEYAEKGYTLEGLNRQIKRKIDAVSAIESFLMAHWEDDKNKINDLAKGTLAYSLADEQLKKKIVELFKLLAQNISQNVPQNSKKKLFGKMLYGLRTVTSIENWVDLHFKELSKCKNFEELLDALWPLLSNNIQNNIFKNCERPEILKDIALGWINGRSFVELHAILKEKDIRINSKKQRRKFKIEHVVDICENAFAYEAMLLIGAIAEIIESKEDIQHEDIINNLRKLQKRIKYGLPNSLSIMFYELGFADRVISMDLGLTLNQYGFSKSSKKALTIIIKEQERVFRKTLAKYPSYFTSVLNNLLKK
ncbi:hypothetical protein [Bacillus smithii]|uniref:hypothetical protein n=1 Tax=Bacillus smithii TaxID=1479 RepID=UPI0030CA071E